MDLSFGQREAIRSLYAYGCHGTLGVLDGPERVFASGSAIVGSAETWLQLVTLGLIVGDGPMRIRLTAAGEQEARRSNPPRGPLCIETTTRADGSTRVRTGRA